MKTGALKTVGEAYDMLFHSRNLLIIAIASALILAILMALSPFPHIGSQAGSSSGYLASLGTTIYVSTVFLATIILSLVSFFMGAVLISSAASGGKEEISASIHNATSRFVSYLGASIVSGIVSFLAFIPALAVLLVLMVIDSGSSGLILLIIAFLALLIPGFYISFRLALTGAVCIVGGKDAMASVKGSWSMLNGNIWLMVLIMLPIEIVAMIVSGIMSWLINPVIGTFLQTLLTYPASIALVLVYRQLTSAAAPKHAGKSKAR